MPKAELSAIQLIANQLNALKSTGPRTEPGKDITKFNARRHGLTGQFYCMSEDDEKAYNTFQANVLPTLKAEGAYEVQLAISIVQDQWRLNRSKAVECNVYGIGHLRLAENVVAPTANLQSAATAAETWREDQKAFANIALYETRIQRMIARNEKRLAELQAEREAAAAKLRAAEAQAREDAELLVRLEMYEAQNSAAAEPQPQAATVEVNGFVFSTAQILFGIARKDRLERARRYARLSWDPRSISTFCGPELPKAA